MSAQTYLVALGSNVRHPRYGAPPGVLRAAMDRLDETPNTVLARSPIIASAPVGPSQRTYANAVLLLASPLDPPGLLRHLKAIEHEFGRRVRGQRWRSRVLDLDIVLWSAGCYAAPGATMGLTIPHPLFRTRAFVLAPAASIAPAWRDPLTGLSLRQLHARLTRHRPLPRQRPSQPHTVGWPGGP